MPNSAKATRWFCYTAARQRELLGDLVPVLAKSHQVIVMDSRGHGRSSRDGKPFGYDLMASDVLGLMDFLTIPKAAIIGWSDGRLSARHRHRSS